MRRENRQAKPLGTGIDRVERNGSDAQAEGQLSRLAECCQLGRRKLLRLQVDERVPLECGPEVHEAGVSLPEYDERCAEILVGQDTLLVRDHEGRIRRNDAPQQNQLALDVQRGVIARRLLQLVRGVALRDRCSRSHEQQPGDDGASHGRSRRVMSPSRVVLPATTWNVVSNVADPGALIRRRRVPDGTSTSKTVPTPTWRSSM